MPKKTLSIILAIWVLTTTLINTDQAVQLMREAGLNAKWWPLFSTQMAGGLLWVPMVLLLFWGSRRFPLERATWKHSLPLLALLVFLVIGFRAVAVFALNPVFHWYQNSPALLDVLWASVRNNFVVAWLLIGVGHAFYFWERERAQRQRAQMLAEGLAKAQLAYLQAQLHPHFLFNTLNSIAELVHVDPQAADRMIVSLSMLLRRSLAQPNANEITVSAELELLQHFLDIEKIRMPERLRVEMDIDREALALAIPAMLLQPLVENAIVHGIARRREPGCLRIAMRVSSQELFVEIENDAPEHERADTLDRPGHGLGLSNVEARLRGLYGDEFQMHLGGIADGKTSLRLALPKRTIGSAAFQPLDAARASPIP